MFVAEGKGGRQRIVPMSRRFFATGAAYLEVERPRTSSTDRLFVVLIPAAAGGRWATGTVGKMLRREVCAARLYLNRTKMESRSGLPARQVKQPREEWILVPCPTIVDDATFDAAARACADNTHFSARRLDPNEQGWLLRGLVVCACDPPTEAARLSE